LDIGTRFSQSDTSTLHGYLYVLWYFKIFANQSTPNTDVLPPYNYMADATGPAR